MLKFIGKGAVVFERPLGEGVPVKAVFQGGAERCPLGDGKCPGLQLIPEAQASEGAGVPPLAVENSKGMVVVCGLRLEPTETGSVQRCHARVGGPECEGITVAEAAVYHGDEVAAGVSLLAATREFLAHLAPPPDVGDTDDWG